MSGLVLLNGGNNGHRSASQRREDQLRAFCDHLLKVVSILTIQHGGLTMVSGASLKRAYDLNTSRDPLTGNIVYSAKVVEGASEEPLMPALDDAAAALTPERPEKEPT